MVLYLIDVIILTKGKEALIYRQQSNAPNFDFKREGDETVYEVKEGALYRKYSKIIYFNLISWLIQWRTYNILFIEGISEPVISGTPKFSPQEIWLIGNSTILGKALRGLLKAGVSNRVLILIIFLVLVIAYYLFGGAFGL